MEARVSWTNGIQFVAESGSGHAVVIDGAPDHGGRNTGMRPMEMLLAGAAGCTAIDVVLILKKMRQAISHATVEAKAERADEDPKVFTKIHLTYRLRGEGLDQGKVEQAVKLSKDKYCSATIMLAKTAEVTYDIEVNAESK